MDFLFNLQTVHIYYRHTISQLDLYSIDQRATVACTNKTKQKKRQQKQM